MKIRSVAVEDTEGIAAIYAPIVPETAISFEWVPPTPEEFRARIVKVTAKYPWLVSVDEQDQVTGFVYASSHRDALSYQWSVNTSVFIRSDRRAQGLGKALYGRLFEQLADAGFHRAFAGVALPNDASVGLLSGVNQGENSASIKVRISARAGGWRA